MEQFPIHDKARVLYVFAEGTMQGIQEILETQVQAAKENGWHIKDSDLENISFKEEKELSLNQAGGRGYEVLSEIIHRENADVVFIDPISLFCTINLDKLENVAKLRAGLNKITGETGCTWVIIHHYRKPKEDECKAVHRIAGLQALRDWIADNTEHAEAQPGKPRFAPNLPKSTGSFDSFLESIEYKKRVN